jgi:hypothetical protein
MATLSIMPPSSCLRNEYRAEKEESRVFEQGFEMRGFDSAAFCAGISRLVAVWLSRDRHCEL